MIAEVEVDSGRRMVLEFQLPEEQEAAEVSLRAMSYRGALWSIRNKLREIRKYKDMTDDQNKLFVEISEFFYEEIEDLNLK